MVKGIPRPRFLLTDTSLETVLSAESRIEFARTYLVRSSQLSPRSAVTI